MPFSCGPSCAITARSAGGSLQRFDPARGMEGRVRGQVNRRLSALMAEQRIRVDCSRVAGEHGVLGGQRCVQLAERAVVPGADVGDRDLLADRRDPHARDAPVLDRDVRCGMFEQFAKGGDGALGAAELLLKPTKVARDQLAAGGEVRGVQDAADVFERHVQITEPVDDLCRGNLREVVAAVAREGIDFRGLKQALFVVVAQRFHAQVRGAGEVADGHDRLHGPRFKSPPAGESTREHLLDPPALAAATVEPSGPDEQAGNQQGGQP